MKSLNILLSLLLVGPSVSLYCADIQPYQSYKGTQITPETLYDLTPKLLPEGELAVSTWLTKPETKTLLEQLLKFEHFPNWRLQHQLDKQLLSILGYVNKSNWNYVFKGPAGYFVKISGPINRLQTMLMTKYIWPGQWGTNNKGQVFVLQENKYVPIATVLPHQVDSYQTASRAAYYLIISELIDKKGLKHIAVPKTYLVHYPIDQKGIADRNVFVVQKAIPADAVKITPERAKKLSDEALTDLIEVIKGVGFWNVRNNIFVDDTGQLHVILHLVDLEQPANAIPKDFFLKDKEAYYGNIKAGIEDLFKTFFSNDLLKKYTKGGVIDWASLMKDKQVLNDQLLLNKLRFIKWKVNMHLITSDTFSPRYSKELKQILDSIIFPEQPELQTGPETDIQPIT